MKPLYVADTVALARYLEDNLPKRANEVFGRAETGQVVVLVPDVVIAEFIYIALKGRLKVQDPTVAIAELLRDLQASQFLRPVSISFETWDVFANSKISELHDRLIYSIAMTNQAEAIITNDPELIGSSYPTIW